MASSCNLDYAFFGSTQYSKELLLFLIENGFMPKIIFSIPQEFNISYSLEKVVNINYANLKEIADAYGIEFKEVDSVDGMRIKDYGSILKELRLDLLLILGWYYMIPKSIRELARYGAWGIHPSLLPKYAGGAPLVWAIINGEDKAGVTLFRMDDGVDDGDIIAQKSFEIDFEDSIKEVYKKATTASKEILIDTLVNIDNVRFVFQDKSKIEIYPQRSPNDGEIDWNLESKKIYDFVRAQTLPYPCAYSNINGKTLKILDCHELKIQKNDHVCGEVVAINNEALVATKDSYLKIGDVIYENSRFRFEDYVRAKNLWGGYSRAKNLRLVA